MSEIEDPYISGELDHFAGTGMTTEFDTPTGRNVHRHSALALVLAAPYAGHTGTEKRIPLHAIPDKLLFAGRSQYRELVRTLEAVTLALKAEAPGSQLVVEAERILYEHNRPHPSPWRKDA